MRPLAELYTDHPLLRVTVPYVTGLSVAAAAGPFLSSSLTTLTIAAAALLATLFFLSRYDRPFVDRWAFGLVLNLLFCVAGAAHYTYALRKASVSWPKEARGYRGLIVAPPKATGKVMLLRVRLTDQRTAAGWETAHNTVQVALYHSATQAMPELHTGDALLLKGKIEPPKNNGNPGEMDYATYLKRQGIGGTCFLFPNQLKKLTPATAHDMASHRLHFVERLKLKALLLRDRMLGRFSQNNISGQRLAVISALTLGDKHLISRQTQQLYSQSGASHILAISGLHLSLLYGMLQLLMFGATRHPRLRIPSHVLLIGFVWVFVFIAGFPVSLQRAAIMCTLVSLAQIFGRETATLNSLSLAALIILLGNPLSLTDVGFQLSFTAVFFIVCCCSWLTPGTVRKHPLGKRIWGIVVTSCCAQMGVAPLVAYYFHTFPSYFLLTNMVIIPLAYVLMGTTLAFFAAFFAPWLQNILARGLDAELRFMQWFLEKICSLPGSAVGVSLSALTVCLAYAFVWATVLWIRRRTSFNAARAALVLCMAVLCEGIGRSATYPMHTVWFYNGGSRPAVQFIVNRDENFLWTANAQSGADSTEFTPAQLLRRYRATPHSAPRLAGSSVESPSFRLHHGVASFCGGIIVLLSDSTWLCHHSRPLKVHYLYICRGFKGHLDAVARTFTPQNVVLDASLSPYYAERYRTEARQHGWKVHDIREQGALKATFGDNR